MKKKLARAISARVKALREEANLSQQEVAQRADLSLSLVAKIEQGKKADPRASTLLALAKALRVQPGRLLDDLFPPKKAGEERNGVHLPAVAVEPSDGKKKSKKKEKGKDKEKTRGKKAKLQEA